MAERPDEWSAGVAAKACGGRVEVAAGRSEYTQVFANPDGTTTFTSSAVPARVRRADKTWTPVDTNLLVRADGSLVPRASVTDVVFSAGGKGPFVTYRTGGSTLSLALPVVLPKPVVDGSSAVYRDVLPDVDLRATATAAGFTHVLVVKTATAAANPDLANIRYDVTGDTLARTGADGRVGFRNPAGRTVAVASEASMWDSTVNPGAGGEIKVDPASLSALRQAPTPALLSTEHGPGVTARTAPIAVAAAADGRGMLLRPDTALLRSPTAVFPLFIDPQIGPVTTRWAYSRSQDSNYGPYDKARVGYNPPEYDGDGKLYRGYFEFPTTYNGQTYKGKHVTGVSFSIELWHSYSCNDTVTNLFRSGGITVGNAGRMNWATRPLGASAVHLASATGHANKAGGCGANQPDMLMTFAGEAMRVDVQNAANANWETYTMGLCACDSNGANESAGSRWKKFYVDHRTTMSVTYNTVPGAPANLSPHLGQVACGGVVGTTSPTLQAQLVDADTGDTLTSAFEWQQLPSGTVNSAYGPTKPANNNAGLPVTLGSGAEGKQYQFRARTNDGTDYSPWSPWCTFTVNTTAPPAPVVTPTASGTAPVYTGCDPGNINACTPKGGPGISGGFTFSEPPGPDGLDVVKYVYGWDTPSTTVTVTAGAATPTIMLTPPRYGINKLTVHSVDAGGLSSPTTVHNILVAAPSAPVAHWPLDSIDNHGLTDTVTGASLTTTGVTWTPDARYIGANAATFNGTGQASQTVPGVSTAGSFSIAVWSRATPSLCATGTEYGVMSMDGPSGRPSTFKLTFDCVKLRWEFDIVADPAASSPTFTSVSTADGTAVPGRWTLVVVSYDKAQNKVKTWVDGALVDTTTPSSGWVTLHDAAAGGTGPVVLGRYRSSTGGDAGRFSGQIADARIWNRSLVADDVTGTNANPATGVPARHGLTRPLEVGTWLFPDGECYCGDTPDGSVFGRKATLVPNWTLDPSWSGDPATTPAWLTNDSHDGNGGVQLDGVSGYVSTRDDKGTLSTADDIERPVLRTDQSSTVTAWVKLDAFKSTDQQVVSQNNFHLYNRGTDHKWSLNVRKSDGSGGWISIESVSDVVAVPGEWVHLAGVFNLATGDVQLYVNGVRQASTGHGATGITPSTSLMIGFRSATNPSMFGGAIDDVHLYQGILNDREIANISSGS
ncbi:LamG-like jellyroll fold domain-containing protein [Dactylosporangium sp. NPDC000521]|uniref:LamG-like jellyroll fold domain-containing protein n=1 Tax=Dactylosporangium sp. NPDC000521 TaxID=3363975 RepID=UPI0036CE5A18